MNICPSCLQTTTGKKFCPYCGYSVGSYAPEDHHIPMLKTVGGQYKVGRCLGEDGFCITYTALDETTNQRCTLKEFYPSDIAERKGFDVDRLNVVPLKDKEELYAKTLERVEKDAKVLASLEPMEGMVKILGCVSENNTVYTAVEFAEGFSTSAYLKENGGKLPANEVFRLMKAPMEALAKVHKAGVFHRGINPEHIIFTYDEKIVLIGFGSARDYDNGKSLAPGFAAPEQYRSNGVVTEATDVYSLCALIYYLLTGKRPQTPAQRMSMDELIKPSEFGDISAVREKTLLKGLEIAEGKRIKSVDELIEGFYSEDEVSEEESEPVSEEKTEPVPVPVPEVKPEPKPEPVPEKKPEPKPEPVPEEKPEPKPEPVPEKKPEPKPEPVTEVKPEPVPEPKPVEEYAPVPEKKKSKAPVVVLVCLLLAAAAVGVMMYMNGSLGGSAPVETAPTETTVTETVTETVPEETEATETTVEETTTASEKYLVPNLTKVPLSYAVKQLESEGIDYIVVETDEEGGMPPEFVVRQEPPADVEVLKKVPVRLFVTKSAESSSDTMSANTQPAATPAPQPVETTVPASQPAASAPAVTTAPAPAVTTAPQVTSAPVVTTVPQTTLDQAVSSVSQIAPATFS